jgi:hypothetical protein
MDVPCDELRPLLDIERGAANQAPIVAIAPLDDLASPQRLERIARRETLLDRMFLQSVGREIVPPGLDAAGDPLKQQLVVNLGSLLRGLTIGIPTRRSNARDQ